MGCRWVGAGGMERDRGFWHWVMNLLPHTGVPGGFPVSFGLIYLIPGLLYGRPLWSSPDLAVHCPGESDSCTHLSGARGEWPFFQEMYKHTFVLLIVIWCTWYYICCIWYSQYIASVSPIRASGQVLQSGKNENAKVILSPLSSGRLSLGPGGQSTSMSQPQGPLSPGLANCHPDIWDPEQQGKGVSHALIKTNSGSFKFRIGEKNLLGRRGVGPCSSNSALEICLPFGVAVWWFPTLWASGPPSVLMTWTPKCSLIESWGDWIRHS